MDDPARIGNRRAREAPRLRIGEAREQMTPRDLRLHARKRSPEAVMNAEAEGQVLAGVVAVLGEGASTASAEQSSFIT